ncbi:MAG TPA: sigma-70 family RNA polymerase sigma factor [Solirubrobacteraceae bacterium]|nr:sigma-70 family RNA polymerase sigma factor [Solirubrobacteraceae bacterium]
MRSLVQHSDPDDSELARRVSSGDGAAFATLDARHRNALQRYAGTLLRRSEHDAEDVVQDVLIRAHEALRAGEVPDELRPWLFRLTRNRAIDEVRRKRWGDEILDSDHAFTGDGREDPETVLRRKEAVRRLIADLADLPVKQRMALLARELDDQSPEQVAAQLGVSVMAAHKLTSRARENLIKTRDARDAACLEIRGTLLDAHEHGARPSEHAVRHVKGCVGCRAYQRDMRRLTKRLQALNPTFGLPILAGLVKLAGGGGAKTAAGAAAAIALAATSGIIVLRVAARHGCDDHHRDRSRVSDRSAEAPMSCPTNGNDASAARSFTELVPSASARRCSLVLTSCRVARRLTLSVVPRKLVVGTTSRPRRLC